ncbi:DUF418 domain-containing protein [Dyadobacter sp.]|uniref:DUF418 domain-containing protein n=1 Tax=Dyadobacter sp. TaxID=1914288 RepID=UPI00326787C3
MTLFAFLFGLGVAVQLGQAEKRNATAWPVYLRRFGVLFIIGSLHALLLWWGDILHWYALLGMVLLVFNRLKNKTILIWGVGLALIVPVGFVNLGAYFSTPAASHPTTQQPGLEATVLPVFAHGTYLNVLQSNWAFYRYEMWSPFMLLFWVITLGTMLLGVWAGRQRLFHNWQDHLPLFRRLFWGGLAIGVTGGIALLINRLFRGQIPVDSLLYCGLKSLAFLGIPAMTAFYVSAIVLLYQSARWKTWLDKLAPVGRLSLTNYLTQTLVWSWLFYGYGLGLGWMGQIGPALALLLGLTLFAGQLFFSTWWLRHFRFGPAEWLWRSLTYGQIQPMRTNKTITIISTSKILSE